MRNTHNLSVETFNVLNDTRSCVHIQYVCIYCWLMSSDCPLISFSNISNMRFLFRYVVIPFFPLVGMIKSCHTW